MTSIQQLLFGRFSSKFIANIISISNHLLKYVDFTGKEASFIISWLIMLHDINVKTWRRQKIIGKTLRLNCENKFIMN